MLYARRVGLETTKPPLFSSNKVKSKKSKELWTKGLKWNNEEKEKYHYFTHPAEYHTNFHPNFNQKERMGTWEKEETHTWSKKNTVGKLKENKIIKLK